MIIANRRTREKLEMTYAEFRTKFAKEIQTSFESYRQTQLNKNFYKWKYDSSMEFNYYFDIRFNFNNFGNSVWYIERI